MENVIKIAALENASQTVAFYVKGTINLSVMERTFGNLNFSFPN